MRKKLKGTPFCVFERPFVLWATDTEQRSKSFLDSLDTEFYARTLRDVIGEHFNIENDAEPRRKKLSALTRMLWSHSVETLVMLFGAYLQCPTAVHAYFLKCKNDDVMSLALAMLDGTPLKYRAISVSYDLLEDLISDIHAFLPADFSASVPIFQRIARHVLADYTKPEHRSEYNSLKHGLRASHGRFQISAGIEDVRGMPAAPEAMQIVGGSIDSSFFDVSTSLLNATNEIAKVNFTVDRQGVSWSLERTLMQIDMISCLMKNTIARIKIINGSPADSVAFDCVRDQHFIEKYEHTDRASISNVRFSVPLDSEYIPVTTAQEVFALLSRPADSV